MITRTPLVAIALGLCVFVSGCSNSSEKQAAETKAAEEKAAAQTKDNGRGETVKMSGGINEWLFDGHNGLMVTSFEQDRTMLGQPVTYYQIKLTLKNHAKEPLTLDEVKTQYLAPDLVQSTKERFGEEAAKGVKPFEYTYAHTSNPDDPERRKVAWTIKPNSTDDVQASGHFYFATKKLQVRVVLLYKGNSVGGPFLFTLKDEQTNSADSRDSTSPNPTKGTKSANRTFIKATSIVTAFEYGGGVLGAIGIPSGAKFLLEDRKTVVGIVESDKDVDKVMVDEDMERRIKLTLKLMSDEKTVATVIARFKPTGIGGKIRKATIDDKWESHYLYDGDGAALFTTIPRVETYDLKSKKKLAETKNIKLVGKGLFSGEEVCYDDDGKVIFRSTFVRHAGTGLLVKETVDEGELPRDYHHYELVLEGWPDGRQ